MSARHAAAPVAGFIALLCINCYAGPLHDAAEAGDAEKLQSLLDAGADVDETTSLGRTALHLAVLEGHVEAVGVLLKAGANTEIKSEGMTALDLAARQGRADVVRLLLASGADPNPNGYHLAPTLHIAADTGNAECVRLLLEAGADVNAEDYLGRTALYSAYGHPAVITVLLDAGARVNPARTGLLQTAAREGDEALVKRLLALGEDVNRGYPSDVDEKPLHHAAERGHVEVARLLIDAGANVDATAGLSTTPLELAVRIGHTGMVSLLLDKGADPDLVSVGNEPILSWAVRRGQARLISLLMGANADVTAANEKGETALHLAAQSGDRSLVLTLIAAGANINSQTSDSQTPLHYAAGAGQAGCAEALLEHGADTTMPGGEWSPLHTAARNGHLHAVRVLLDGGAPVDELRGFWGDRTPLMEAVWYQHPKVAELLIEYGAELTLQTAAGLGDQASVGEFLGRGPDAGGSYHALSPLAWAAASGQTEMIGFLLERGVTSPEKDTAALFLAAERGHAAAARVLLEHGAQVSAIDEATQETPLHRAAASGQAAAVSLLIGAGAGIEVRDLHGQTPLHHAADHGHATVVQLLLEHGADAGATTHLGDTALDIARLGGFPQVAYVLQTHGLSAERITSLLTPATVLLNGSPMNLGQVPFIFGDRAYVPVRQLAESLRLQCDYNPDTRAARITRGWQTLDIQAANALELGGVLFAPANRLSALGYRVGWNQQARVVSLTDSE